MYLNLGKKWLLDGLAVVGLATAVLLFFWPVVSGQAWIPRGGGDLVSFVYPMYRFAAQSLHNGELPLWNPFLYAGAPFLADNQSGLFYPPNLLLFLLNPRPSYRAIEGLVLFHFWLAGTSLYLCLRGWQPHNRIAILPAMLGALAFMFSDLFITHIGNLNLNAVIAWLPLALLALHRAIEAVGWQAQLRWALLGGLVVSVSTLAGHGQMTFMVGTFLGCYGLYRAVVGWSGRPLIHLAVMGVVGMAGAALALLPAVLLIPHTVRAAFDFAQSTNYSLPLEGLVGLLAPNFYGRGFLGFWGGWPRVEAGYAGVLPWLLAPLPFLLGKTRQALFFALAGALFLLLALGGNSPVYGLLFGWLPIVPFQVPARFVVLANLCLAILAALGLDELLKQIEPQRARRTPRLKEDFSSAFSGSFAVKILWWLGGTAVFLLVFGVWLHGYAGQLSTVRPDKAAQMGTAVTTFAILAGASWLLLAAYVRGWLLGPWVAGAAVLLLAIDLIGLGRNVEIEPNDPTLGFAADSPALAFIQGDDSFFRVEIDTEHWQPSLGQIERLYDMGGVYNPLQLANYNVYKGSLGFRGSPLYNLLGVKYIVASKGPPPGDTTFLIPVFEDDPQVTVYLNTLALPRILLVPEAAVLPDKDAVFTAVHDPAFDPRQTIFLESGEPLAGEPAPAELLLLRYDLNEAAVQVNTTQPAYLLLTDMAAPGWTAEIDGQPAEIVTANYAFRAVLVSSGQHEVQFSYRPPGWVVGLVLSLLTWLLVGTFFWKKWDTDKHRLPQI
ncbi:MAG: YfhO family protein [Anaerolineaceae bacterium]|nr:YfhO family protein [Anaerolineaceae bacterium]